MKICYEIADKMADQLHAKNINNLKIIKVAFVNIDNINQVSSNGRAYSEFIASRLCQRGFQIIELKLRTDNVEIIPFKGELILSYDQINLAKEHDASAVLVGYYKTIKREDLSIFARVININNNVILASQDISSW